ncbi:MAG: Clp protease ClpP [Vallitaleaceae bacterium]|nr:Clp protease ClpP [Vallitaleaceae bacterium]
MNKFYEIKNEAKDTIDIYIYGYIVSGADKWDESDVTYKDFQCGLEGLKGTETVNLYVNSGGGSVIATQGIVAMLQRAKDKGVIINATIDGLGASCASFLPLLADNVFCYLSSLMMVHKPMMGVGGNANDLQDGINLLNKIEDNVMMPIYMAKVNDGISEEYIRNLVNAETWLSASEMAEIFNITILEDDKELVACTRDREILNKYKNTPKGLKFEDEIESEPQVPQDNKEIENLKAKLLLECLI